MATLLNNRAERDERFLGGTAIRTGGVAVPEVQVADCADWKDNRVLELAGAAGAFLIVSGDRHLLEMSPWRGIAIIGPSHFVARVDALRRRRACR